MSNNNKFTSEENNIWKWNKFVEIGKTIHKIRIKEVKIRKARAALLLSDELMKEGNTFIINSKERYELYEALLPEIAQYLDGTADAIQAAIREHFLFQHGKAGLHENLFEISFSPKKVEFKRDLL